jgi:vancomycin resistance protein VanW
MIGGKKELKNKKVPEFYTVIVVFVTILTVFVLKSYGIQPKKEVEQIRTKYMEPLSYIPKIGRVDAINDTNGLKSGPVTSLPWENSEDFIRAKGNAGTPVLMAAYRTVLRDPLPGEEENVHLAARMLAGTVLEPGTVLSQNQTIGPYIEEKGFKKGPTYIGPKLTTTIGGGVCKIASTLYNVVILSNLQVVERHCHSMPVPYVPYGQDATVSYGNKDMKFKNDSNSPILVWAKGIDNVLYIAFYGREEAPKVDWNHETLNVQKAQINYNINPNLPAGSEKVVLEGMDGASIKSWVTITYPDGRVETKNLGVSNYRPFDSLIEKN